MSESPTLLTYEGRTPGSSRRAFCFGRLSKRFEEASNTTILSALERLTGAEVTPEERQRIARGADELDLVNSGLEETMVNAYETIRQTMPQEAPNSLDAAVYVDIVTYLFKANGSPAGAGDLPADRAILKQVMVTAREERR